MTHPVQQAKQRRKKLARRVAALRARPFSVPNEVEATRAHECFLRRYNGKVWLSLQREVTKQVHPLRRVGYASLSKWNRKP